MPFINSKVTTKISTEQEQKLKTELGKAIELIPGKSEQWLMLNFEPEQRMYFQGDNSEDIAFIDVSIYGGEDREAFSKMTEAICRIFNEVLGISPDHIYVKYSPCTNWGWNGSNF